MSLTLRKLLHNPSLKLRLVIPDVAGETGSPALDEEFEWLHATDLLDPTPFLGPAEVILTLGWQFPIVSPGQPDIPAERVSHHDLTRVYEAYVRLVHDSGVIGIGFAADVVHRGIPDELVEACKKFGLILFEVPYEISFMDLLQEAARVMQRDQTERYTRSLRAQKAIAHAATRRDGLNATLSEASRQLGCCVALYDPIGQPVRVIHASGFPDDIESRVTPLVRAALSNGQRFTSHQLDDELEVTLQSLGEQHEPSGVLVLVLNRSLDELSRNVMSSVLALISVSLQQNQSLDDLRQTLRDALLQLTLTGERDASRHIIDALWGEMPAPPLAAIVGVPSSIDPRRLMSALEGLSLSTPWPLFFARHRGNIAVLVREGDLAAAVAKLKDFGMHLGYSTAQRWSDLPGALDEAGRAAAEGLRRGTVDVVPFESLWRDGVSDLIDAADGAHIASRMLGRVVTHDREHATELIGTLRVWLRHNGRPLPTARELGIHRHTLANRLDQISDLVGLDLDHSEARADLIVALRYLSPSASHPR